MPQIPKQISEFLASEHVLSLCVCEDNEPYVCSCFYAFCAKLNALIIASDESTKHIKIAQKNNQVAINIAYQTKVLGLIKGVQARGVFASVSGLSKDEQEMARSAYFKDFGFARVLAPKLFVIRLKWLKFTNNALAKKLIWEQENE